MTFIFHKIKVNDITKLIFVGPVMKPVINIDSITLAVSDLSKSKAFYEGLGLSISNEGNPEDHIVIELDNLNLVLYLRSKLEIITNQTSIKNRSLEVILSFIVRSKEEVDSILDYVIIAGGNKLPNQPNEDDDGYYSGHFKDPDGHLWEVSSFYEYNRRLDWAYD
jgi:uncharacterized protein